MATTIDFESGYSLGNINGQNGWVGSSTVVQIVSSPVYAGTRGLSHSGGAWDNAYKELDAGATGSMSFRIRWNTGHVDPWRGGTIIITPSGGATVGYQVGMYSSSGTQVGFYGSTYEIIGTYSLNTWYLIEVEWTATQGRGRFNGGSWSSWLSPAASYSSLARIQTSTLSTTFYVDDIVWNAGAVGPANLKSYNTNTKSNIKSINTNAIANIKSLNTNV